jgi:hypothetical protein
MGASVPLLFLRQDLFILGGDRTVLGLDLKMRTPEMRGSIVGGTIMLKLRARFAGLERLDGRRGMRNANISRVPAYPFSDHTAVLGLGVAAQLMLASEAFGPLVA